MKKLLVLTIIFGLAAVGAWGQGILGDILAGKLIDPEVGVYAWYEITDAASGRKLWLRLAIVDKERVKLRTGYWLETEVKPQVGFPEIYKMLLTGPANDADNVHRILLQQDGEPPREIPVEDTEQPEEEPKDPERKSLGPETVTYGQETIEAEHIVIGAGEEKVEVWVNDKVRPMGVVRLVSQDGELLLQRYGTGGPDAQSALSPEAGEVPEETRHDVRVHVENGVSTNFSGRDGKE